MNGTQSFSRKECVLLGFLPPDKQPLWLPRAALNEHMYVCGQSGSGKTSLGFMPLMIQLAREWQSVKRDDVTGELLRHPLNSKKFYYQAEKRPAIVVLDLKGEPPLFNACRMQADKHYPDDFRFYSIEHHRPGHIFDVFKNLWPRPALEMTELLMQALGLWHGEGYGRSYYSRAHRRLMSETLIDLQRDKATRVIDIANSKPIVSWDDLLRKLSKKRTEKNMPQDAEELLHAVHALSLMPRLDGRNLPNDHQHMIHFPTALKKRQMVYFWLPSGASAMAVREIGKLALYSLFQAAKELADKNQKVQTYVFIDEFHMLAGRNMEQILTQARSAGISFILANQYPSRLAEEELDLRAMVRENARIRQFFTLTDPRDIEELEKLSGQRWEKTPAAVSHQYEYGMLGTWAIGHSVQERMLKTSRLDPDIARQVTTDPIGSVIHMPREMPPIDFGGVPQWIESFYPWSSDLFAKMNGFHSLPWPTPNITDPPPPKSKRVPSQAELVPDTAEAKAIGQEFNQAVDVSWQMGEE